MKKFNSFPLLIIVLLVCTLGSILISIEPRNNLIPTSQNAEVGNGNTQTSQNALPQNSLLSPSSPNSVVSSILIQNPTVTAIYTVAYNGQTYYTSSTGRVGDGSSIYNSDGVKIADCPVLPNRPMICTYHFTGMTLLWKL